MRGMDVVEKVESVGSQSGQPGAVVKISDSGELPLLRHLRGGGDEPREPGDESLSESLDSQPE